MRLFLSSHGIATVPHHLDRLHELVGQNDKRVLFIDNAKDYYVASERAQHVAEKKREFEQAGFEFFELDLRTYFRSPAKLQEIVDAASFVWASGGNEFLLRRAYSYSGFDSMLKNALRADSLVYGGSSAGSMILTKTLRGSETCDDPYLVPEGYKEEILWDGLAMIHPQLVPHVDSGWFDEDAKALMDFYDREGMHYVPLKDGQVYVVDGDKEEVLT